MSSEKQTKHSIGDTIAVLRKQKGWTQAELAEKLNVSDKAVSKWEQDGGAPSIEFLVPLAEILGVSIDYLLTGKIGQPNLDGILNFEYICKNDAVEVMEYMDKKALTGKDENGLTMLDYMLKYRCEKVVKAFSEEVGLGTDRLAILVMVEYEMLDRLMELKAFSEHLISGDRRTMIGGVRIPGKFDVHNDAIFSRVLVEDRYKGEFRDRYLEYFGGVQYREAIEYTLRENKAEAFRMLWKRVLNINAEYYAAHKKLVEQLENEPIWRRKFPRSYEVPYIVELGKFVKNDFFVVRVPEEILRTVVDCGYFEEAREYSSRIDPIPEEWFTLAELKLSGKGSTYEAIRLSVMDEGLVNLEKLKKIEDYDTAKKLLFGEPITELELACWNEITKSPDSAKIDRVFDEYTDISDGETVKLKRLKYTAYCYDYPYHCKLASRGVNDDYIKRHGAIDKKLESSLTGIYNESEALKIFESMLALIKSVKEEYFRPWQEVHDRQVLRTKLTQRYPYTYFKELLEKGDTETAVVKLCVLLEGLLTTGYSYEGDLSDLINEFCDEHEVDDNTRDLLHKLRTLRNSYVHPVIENVDLTEKEILQCIDYVFKIAK